MAIEWSNPNSKVSKYFTVKECLWLPQWKRLANEADGLSDLIKENLIELCKQMDEVRVALAAPLTVHCCYRPEAYNKLVGGAKNSAHKSGQAIDFDAAGASCDDIRKKILELKLLPTLRLRMEDLPASSWVHIDTRKPSAESARFFKP